MKKTSFIIFGAAVTGFIVWAMLYQSGTVGAGKKTPAGEKTPPPPEEYVWRKLEPLAEPTVFKAVGTVRSREEIDVISRLITARVTEVPFRNGERFKSGDVLIKMEDRDLQAKVDAAAENLKGAESRLKFAEAEDERNATLVRSRAVAARDYEESTSNLDAARAQTAMMKHELLNAQTNLEYATIRAPFDGVVSERGSDPGDLATPLNPLMKIFNPSKLQVQIPVREGLYSKVKNGDELRVAIRSTGREYTATVREIVPAVDAGSRSFIVNAGLDGATDDLMPGMFAVCEIPTGTRTVLAVPETAVRRIGQLEYLTVKDQNGRAVRTLVKTVPLGNGLLEIISGVQPGVEYTESRK